MKTIARVSTAAFLAGVTTLAVTLPMPVTAKSGASGPAVASQPAVRDEQD